MTQKYILPVLAVIGLGIAIAAVIQGNLTPAIVQPVVQPVKVPFGSYIAGAGMIETRTENIAIGTPVSGIVMVIIVKWGDWVKAGDPLFKIDDRDVRGQLVPAIAKVKEAEATLAKLRNLLSLGERMGVGPISALDLANRRFDVSTAEAVLGSAQAQVEQLRVEVERRTIRAPVDGRILQIKTHPGEFADSDVLAKLLMLLGDDTRLHVRVDIDENATWRVRPVASAMCAATRSSKQLCSSSASSLMLSGRCR